jgi:hypothetical protein
MIRQPDQPDSSQGAVMSAVSRIARDTLENFWERHGLPARWEENAIYEVATGFGFFVRLTVEEETGLIRAWTTLCPEAPDERREAVHAALLEANLADCLVFGGSLALDPETLEVVYQRAYDPRQSGAGGFSLFFIAFAEAASGLQAAVAALISGDENAPVWSGRYV